MQSKYVKIKSAYDIIDMAERKNQTLFIAAQVGSGKTAAVKYYYRNKQVLYLSGESGLLSDMPDVTEMETSTIVIDDISWLQDEKSIEYVKQLVKSHAKHLILVGRSGVPSWLTQENDTYPFLFMDYNDMLMSRDETRQMLEHYGATVSDQIVRAVYKDMCGYVLGTQMIAQHLAQGEPHNKALLEAARQDCFRYFDHSLYEKWDPDMREMLLVMAEFQEFDVKMTELITGRKNAAELLERARTVGSFLKLNEDRKFEMQLMLRRYFLWKRAMVLHAKELTDIYNRAGLYFELEGQVETALCYYDKAQNEEQVSKLLVRNAENHPGTAHFFETREYYFRLPEEIITESPTLMAGMSMLYAILLQVEESDAWYDRLVQFEKSIPRNDPRKKEAWGRIAYLQIALPQTGALKISTLLKDITVLCLNSNVRLPEFSVTSNLPSTMNGGKDFSEWSKKDRELATTLKKPVELILGRYSAGLVNTALAESLFEKGSPDAYEIVTLLNSGFKIADTKGKIEMCFAAVGILVRLHVSKHQLSMAMSQLDDFQAKAEREGAWQLMDNIRTMQMWFRLLTGDKLYVQSWVAGEAPDEHLYFYILERYRYMMKIRAYIALDRLGEAAGLVERVNVYVKLYYRYYMSIELNSLKAIVQFRMGEGDWQSSLNEALKTAEEYHFIRAIAQEGAAIQPLLARMDKVDVSAEFMDEVRVETDKMARYYPNYLQDGKQLEEPFTDMEQKVLTQLCKGKSLQEISQKYDVSYSTVKYHSRNVYRKLGVKNRQEAQAKAIEMKIV